MRVFGAVGWNGSGKDVFMEYISEKYGLPMITMGDLVREVAIKNGVPPTRENLTQIAVTRIDGHGKDYWPKRVLERIEENQWDTAGIAGIRSYADAITYRKRFGDDFVLIHVETTSPKERFIRLRARAEPRDPKTWEEFSAQDEREEQVFGVDRTTQLANYTINNDGTLKELYASIDEFLRTEFGIQMESRARNKHWFLLGSNYNHPTYNMIQEWDDPNVASHYRHDLQPPFAQVLHALEQIKASNSLLVVDIGDLPEELDYMSLVSGKFVPYFDLYLVSDKESDRVVRMTREILFERIPKAIPRGKYFLLFAPDQSICVSGVFKARACVSNIGVIIFDKHLDVGDICDDDMEVSYPAIISGSNFVEALTRIVDPDRIVVLAPTTGPNLRYVESYRRRGLNIYLAAEGDDSKSDLQQALAKMQDEGVQHIYISVDVDAVKEISSVYFKKGEPPFLLAEIIDAIAMIKQDFTIIGGDVAGFYPTYLPLAEPMEKESAVHVAQIIDTIISAQH